MTFDDVAAEHAAQGVPFKFAERRRRTIRPRGADVEKGASADELARVVGTPGGSSSEQGDGRSPDGGSPLREKA